jgi:hypothetical protein
MRKLSDFERLGLPVPAETEYFAQLLRYPLARWELISHPRLLGEKVFRRVYRYLPAWVRQRTKPLALGQDRQGQP